MVITKLLPTQWQATFGHISVNDETNMYTDVSSSTYSFVELTGLNVSGVKDFYLGGFEKNKIPAGSEVTGYTVRIKIANSHGQVSTAGISLYGGARGSITDGAIIPGTTLTNVKPGTLTLPTDGVDWDVINSLVQSGKLYIHIPIQTLSNDSGGGILVYGAEIEVTYELPEKYVTGRRLQHFWDNAKNYIDTEIPTNVSDLQNDAGYLTQHQSLTNYALKSEIPTVPTNVSAFTNDSGYINDLSPYIYYSQNSNTVYINSATEITDTDEVTTIKDEIGDLSQLETTAKDNLVSAINEENEAVAGINERLVDVKAELNDTENGIKIITGNNILQFVDGYYINTSGSTADVTNLVANSSFRVAVMECESGDKFRITAQGSAAAKTWAFIASNGNVISAVTHNSALDNYLLTAPDNSAYIVVNDRNTGGICYYGNALLVSRVTDLENYRVNKNIDLINISRERPLSPGQYYTLQTAIEEVYTYYQKARHGGTIVVFNDTYSTTRAYQYIYDDTIAAATNFKNPTKWRLINTTTKQAIVVAAYDSSDEAKRNADFVATSENNGIDIINTAIRMLGSGGGRVYLRNGTYKSTYGVNILYDNIVLEGESLGVVIQRDGANAIFSQAARTGIILSNLTVNNPVSFASGSKVYTHDCFIQNLYTDSHHDELNIVYVTPEQGIEGINAAIDSMTTGGKIVLSSGTYTNVVSGSTAGVRFFNMTAKNNITIEGQGYTTVISRSTGTNDVIGNGSGVSNNIIQNVRIAHTITRPTAPDSIKAVRLVGCWINTDYVDESQEQTINICNVGTGRYFETLFDALQSFYASRTKFNISDRWEINIYGHIVETKQVSINRDYINFRGHNALVEFRGDKGVHLNVVNETSPYGYGDHETCVEIRDIHFLKTGCYNYYDEPCVNVEKDNVRFYNCIFENASSSPSPFNQGNTQPTTDTKTGSRRHGIEVKCTKYGDECRTEFHGCVGIGSPYGFQNTRGWYLIFGAPKLFDCVGIGGGIGEYGHGILNHRSSKAILVGCVGYAGPKNYRQSAGIRFQASGSSDLTSCIGYGGCGEQFKSNGVSAARVTEICTALGIDSSAYVINGVVRYDQLTNPTPSVHKESDDICAQLTNDDVQIVALDSGTEEGYGISFWAHDGSPKLIDCQGYMGTGENSHGIHAIAYTNPTIIGGYYGVQDILQNLEIVTGANNEAVLTPTSGLNDYTPYAITGMSLTFIGGAAESGSTITVETNETTPTVLVNDFSITGQSSILHIPVTETVVPAGVALRVWIKVNGTKIAVAANRFILLVQYHYANTGASAVYIGSNATPHIYKAIIKAHGTNKAVEVESGRAASVDMYDCAMHGTVDESVSFTPKTAINGSSNYVI